MLGKESLRASQRVDYSGYGDEEDANVVYEENVRPNKKLPLRVSDNPPFHYFRKHRLDLSIDHYLFQKHHILSLDDIQAIRMVSPTSQVCYFSNILNSSHIFERPIFVTL